MTEDGSLRERVLGGLGRDHPLLWLALALVFAGFAYVESGWLQLADLLLMALCFAFGVLALRRRGD
ncbi:MAG: hypothetical protein ABEJ06_04740 [Haloarculaceae archaeon]